MTTTPTPAPLDAEERCVDCGDRPRGYSAGRPYCGTCHKSHFERR